jgi:hypothetical protein
VEDDSSEEEQEGIAEEGFETRERGELGELGGAEDEGIEEEISARVNPKEEAIGAEGGVSGKRRKDISSTGYVPTMG